MASIKAKSCILVLGLGKTGNAALNFLHNKGHKVIATDNSITALNQSALLYKNTSIIFEEIAEINLDKVDYMLVSPGIRTIHNPHVLVQLAKSKNIPIISDLDILRHYYPTAKYIGITGSNGKSTTVTILYHIFKFAGKNVILNGNIGISMLTSYNNAPDFFIIELSSYQLELSREINIDFAAILNVHYHHLEYHGGFENYLLAKKRIYSKSKYNFINFDDSYLRNYYEKEHQNANYILFSSLSVMPKGYSFVEDSLYHNGVQVINNFTYPREELIGDHNKSNLIAAIAIAAEAGLDYKIIASTLSTYQRLEHRMEFVRKIDNIEFINDSKSTQLSSTLSALKCFDAAILIIGGKNDEDNPGDIKQLIEYSPQIKKIFLIGETTESMGEKLIELGFKEESDFVKSFTLTAALEKARKESLILNKDKKYKRCAVLLSPMRQSLDQYKNFEERGKHFKEIVSSF